MIVKNRLRNFKLCDGCPYLKVTEEGKRKIKMFCKNAKQNFLADIEPPGPIGVYIERPKKCIINARNTLKKYIDAMDYNQFSVLSQLFHNIVSVSETLTSIKSEVEKWHTE